MDEEYLAECILQAINYLLAAFCAYAGHVAYLGNLGDYAKYALGFSDEIYTTGTNIKHDAKHRCCA